MILVLKDIMIFIYVSTYHKRNIINNNFIFLKKYELRRKTLNSAMIKGVDLIFNLFQEESPYLRLLRNSGLKAVNKFSLLKKNFILHASGIHKI